MNEGETDRAVAAVVADLDQLEAGLQDKSRLEAELTGQIAALRAQLSSIQKDKTDLKIRRRRLEKEKESAERKEALAEEQIRIEADLDKVRQEVEKLIADAPWREKIYDWQLDGAVRLSAAGRGLLADVRGMGKTLTSLAWRRATGSKKTLVLTRRQYAKEFIREVNFWEPNIEVVPIIAANPTYRKMITGFLQRHDEFIVVGNFEMWRRSEDAIKDLLSVGFDSVILDEAHQLKRFNSVTTKGFMQLAPQVDKLLTMTGTPVQNRPQELFAILHALWPNMFPTERKFVNDYCWQIDQNHWKWAPGGLEALREKMSTFFVARTPEDVGHKIPPPSIIEYELDLEGYDEQREIYQFIAERALAKLNSGKVLNITHQLEIMLRQAQLVSWPAGIIFRDKDTGEIFPCDVYQSVKVDWAEDLIKELVGEEQRIVLFSRFKPALFELEKRLKKSDIPVAVVTGETKDTEPIIQDFDLKTAPKEPKFKVLMATYQTIGEAVNLNAARHLIQLDRFWKPTADDQAIGRIDRINSMDQATVHRPIVSKTIDVFMDKLIKQKREMLNDFKGAGEVQEDLIANLEESL